MDFGLFPKILANIDLSKQSATDLNYFKKSNLKNSKNSDLISSKIADKITRTSAQNTSEIVSNKTEDLGFDAKTLKGIYPQEKRQQIIAELRLIQIYK